MFRMRSREELALLGRVHTKRIVSHRERELRSLLFFHTSELGSNQTQTRQCPQVHTVSLILQLGILSPVILPLL